MTTRVDLSGATWHKSSYSNGDGGDCVEVADGVPGVVPLRDSKRAGSAGAAWHKSSYSNGDGGNCVEVAPGVPGVVPVRDSKRAGDPGAVVVFPADCWGAFLDAVKHQHI